MSNLIYNYRYEHTIPTYYLFRIHRCRSHFVYGYLRDFNQTSFFYIPSLDLAIVGRWIGHFRKGIFLHNNIIQAQKVNGEFALGWFAHYAIGIALAFLLLLICGIEWVYKPTFWICITLGVATTAAPWFMMQPAFGFGIAASKTPNPTIARLRSLQAHAIYGFGLYLAAVLLSNIIK